MIEAFTAYIKTISALTVFAVAVGLLMPNGSFRRYTRWVLGLLVLLAVLQPVLGLFDLEKIDFSQFLTASEEPVLYDADLGETWTQKALEEEILAELQKTEPEVEDVHIVLDEENGLPAEMEISGKDLPESLAEETAKRYGMESDAVTLVP